METFRTIMLFPHFKNMEVVNDIRSKYDPLFGLVRPHITLVFPFQSEMSNERLSEKLNSCLSDVKKFTLEMQGFSAEKNDYGNYMQLNVTKSEDIITTLSKTLYEKIFNQDISANYKPHLTVGKLNTLQEMKKAYETIKDNKEIFTDEIDTIYVEMIGNNNESIIVIEKKLGE